MKFVLSHLDPPGSRDPPHAVSAAKNGGPERRTAAETAGEAGGEALGPSRAEAATVASCNSALAAAIVHHPAHGSSRA